MSGVSTSLNTNPNAKGGSFNYDSRTGLGYGQTKNGGLGSNWSMGDALSSPKGEWDNDLPINNPGKEIVIGPNTTVEELAIAAGIIEVEDEEITSVEAGINSKANTSLHMPTVDFAAKKKRNPNSYVGLANTSAYLGASHKRNGEVVLENYIREILLEKTAIGPRHSLAGTVGDPYKPGKQHVSNTSRGAGHRGSINYGYNLNSKKGTELDKDLYPYVNTPNKPVHKSPINVSTDGKVHTSQSLNVSKEALAQDDDIKNLGNARGDYHSTAEIMLGEFGEEKKAEQYVNRHR